MTTTERVSWRCTPPPGGGLPALEVVAATKVGAITAVQRLIPEIQRHAAVQYHYEIVEPDAPIKPPGG
jgi:hypothetical protein